MLPLLELLPELLPVHSGKGRKVLELPAANRMFECAGHVWPTSTTLSWTRWPRRPYAGHWSVPCVK